MEFNSIRYSGIKRGMKPSEVAYSLQYHYVKKNKFYKKEVQVLFRARFNFSAKEPATKTIVSRMKELVPTIIKIGDKAISATAIRAMQASHGTAMYLREAILGRTKFFFTLVTAKMLTATIGNKYTRPKSAAATKPAKNIANSGLKLNEL